jgi:predicted esterase
MRKKTYRLRANRVIEIRFPDLPDTFYAKRMRRRIQPTMTFHLPRNYSAAGRFPLIVYLDGGHGGPSTKKTIGKARMITDDREYIAVTLPLFKKTMDPAEAYEGLLMGAREDYPLISRCFRTMLTELERVVPNIDFERSSLGGFSNGAHTIAVLLSEPDRFITRHFRNFYLVEGGWRMSALHKAVFKEKNFLYLMGGKHRKRQLSQVVKIAEGHARIGRKWGVNIEARRMYGVGHAFPERYMRSVRAWISRMK